METAEALGNQKMGGRRGKGARRNWGKLGEIRGRGKGKMGETRSGWSKKEETGVSRKRGKPRLGGTGVGASWGELVKGGGTGRNQGIGLGENGGSWDEEKQQMEGEKGSGE